MASHRVTHVLCAAEPHGSVAALERLADVARDRDVHAIALVGNLGGGGNPGPEVYRALIRALAQSGLPSYWVPGPEDAPIDAYLREAYNMELVFPLLRGVHGTAAYAPGPVLFAGLGGEVSDDPNAPREERERLRYPRWEAEYRLKLLRELPEHESVLLFWTPPAHKGEGSTGSEALAELINTHRPRLVVCGGLPGTRMLGRSLVVAPGRLAEGSYAIADLHKHEAEFVAGSLA